MGKIKLVYQNNQVLLWNTKDWEMMRHNRIYGKLVGNLGALPRQDSVNGFPMNLLPEETTLLLEKNLAVLVKYPNLASPSAELVNQCLETRMANFQGQINVMKVGRRKELEEKINLIVEGKKKVLLKAGKVEEADKVECESLLNAEISKISDPSLSVLGVQICTADPWIDEEECEEQHWNYPRTEKEHLHYAVFKDLWEKGFHVTGGGKFGADFLAYPADPMVAHAQFIVLCVEIDTPLEPLDIVTFGRLGHSVRKTFVFAYLKQNRVCYQSLTWAE